MTSTEQRSETGSATIARPWSGGLFGSAGALVLNSVIFFGANAALAGSIQTAQSGQAPVDLPYAAVLAASVIPVFVGAAVLWGLLRFTRLGLPAWSILALAVAVLSVGAPLTAPIDGGSKIALSLMHLATGAAAILGQRRAVAKA